MEAVVLAGGLGTRLRSVVGELPKPMAPVAGRPFLEILLETLARGGIARVVLSVGYRRESIVSHFGDDFAGLQISYCEEATPLGTGGAIRRAMGMIDGDRSWIFNGDTFVDLDHRDLRHRHAAALQADPTTAMTMAIHRVADAARYGTVETASGRVIGFHPAGSAGPGWINAGVYLMERSVLKRCDHADPFSFERELLEPRVADLCPLAYETSGRFIDIGVPEDFERAQILLA